MNHKRVGRVMRKFGIAGLRLRKRHVTTVPDPSASPVPDLLQRDITATAPNTKYVGDITYLPVGDGGFLYSPSGLNGAGTFKAGQAVIANIGNDLTQTIATAG